jgi:uncharacterized protein YdcH (DUF465 family)
MIDKGDSMGTGDAELIETLTRENEEFKTAKEHHAQHAKHLDELEKKPFLTPQDDVEIKVLKKKKLACKDQMEKILTQYRKGKK